MDASSQCGAESYFPECFTCRFQFLNGNSRIVYLLPTLVENTYVLLQTNTDFHHIAISPDIYYMQAVVLEQTMQEFDFNLH